MKVSILLAAAFASLTIAAPASDSNNAVEARDEELEARQRGDCAVGVYFGDYGCYIQSTTNRHFIGVCERNGSITRIAFCPGVCRTSAPGYPYCA